MSTSRLGAALFLALSPLLASATESVPSLHRWVKADDVRVRSGAGAEFRITGLLGRGTQVYLTPTAQKSEFCLVAGDGQSGYVACNLLSDSRIARPKAGQEGIDAAQRWVSGNAVTMRDAPRQDAVIVGRLGVNTIVKLVNVAASGYCEVQPASGPSGFTACRYLVQTPVVLAAIRGVDVGDAPAGAGYDPERAFWLEPSVAALEAYAYHLNEKFNGKVPSTGWPRNEALERMKAHLALGISGPKPAPFPDWSRIKTRAAAQAGGSELADLTYLSHAQFEGDKGAIRVVNLVRGLEFASVRPSLFRSEAEVAPPIASAEDASGRFGIIVRHVYSRRSVPPGQEPGYAYDLQARTQSLTKPVQRVQILRDGHLRTAPSVMRNTTSYVDETECAGWTPGFAFGDADRALWKNHGGTTAQAEAQGARHYVASTVFTFYTPIVMPHDVALQTELPVKLDREKTGFVSGVHLYYDLDRDGVPDIGIWEGQGKGPGHMDELGLTDDRWYRLAVVNINGVWKLLGIDTFEYGCGC